MVVLELLRLASGSLLLAVVGTIYCLQACLCMIVGCLQPLLLLVVKLRPET